jgi:hypothetical protein
MTDMSGNAYTFDGAQWSDPHQITEQAWRPSQVSCPTTDWCLALFATRTAAKYNDTAWAPVPSSLSSESALSCTSSSMCMAVGATDTERFNGTAWTVLDSGTKHLSISCASTTFCVGVTPNEVQTFDGAQWHTAVPDDELWNVDSRSVSCPSPQFCLVIDGMGRQIVYRDGSWEGPYPTLTQVPLEVSCYSDTFCQSFGFGYSQTFDGHYWSAVNRSGAAAEIDDTTALSCYGVQTCMAADLSQIFSSTPL